MLAYYVTQKSNMASKMAANTSKWPQVHNYWLKFDDLDVYPQVFGGKEHINTTLDITDLLNHYEIEFMTFSCPLSPNAQTPLSIERSVLIVILLLSIDLLSVVWIVTVFSLARATGSSAGESIASAAASRGFASPRTVAMDNFQELIRRSIVLGHNWN